MENKSTKGKKKRTVSEENINENGDNSKKTKKAKVVAGEGRKQKGEVKSHDDEDLPRGHVSKNSKSAASFPAIEKEENLFGNKSNEEAKKQKIKKQKKKSTKKVDAEKKEDDDLDQFVSSQTKIPKKVTPFTFKSLSKGTILLGAIREINEMDIVVSLPNNLKGFVKITEVSDTLTEILKKQEELEEGRAEDQLPDLNRFFRVGQLVRCVVIEMEVSESGNRIELSLRASRFNETISFDNIYVHMLISGSVVSVEDHGYVISFGISDNSTGFLKRKAAEAYCQTIQVQELIVGQPLEGIVVSLDKEAKTANISIEPELLAKTQTKQSTNLLTLETLKAGMLVNAKVRAILPNGLFLSFMEYFSGTVDLYHIQKGIEGDFNSQYKEKEKVNARILYLDYQSKHIALTLKPHLVNFSTFQFPNLKIGDIFEEAVIKRIDSNVGMLMELTTDPSQLAFVHISHASDDRVEKLEKKFKVGGKHRCRVIGFNYLDGLVNITLKQTQIEEPFMTVNDVHVGSVVEGKIQNIYKEGIQVTISKSIRGRCPSLHFADVRIQKPQEKFKVGQKFKCRVLQVDPKAKKIILSHKKSLVQSTLPILTTFESAEEGIIVHGYITKIEKYGCIVSFYNGIHGLVPANDLEKGFAKSYFVGQVVKCRIVQTDSQTRRMTLSFNITPSAISQSSAFENILCGEIVQGKVSKQTEGELEIETSDGLKGILAIQHIGDHPSHWERILKSLVPGHQLDSLLVLEKDLKRKQLVLSMKASLIKAAQAKQLPLSIEDLKKGIVYPGFIKNITHFGCFIGFLNGVTGVSFRANLSDGYVMDPADHFILGQSVRAYVMDSDTPDKVSLSLKHSLCFSTDSLQLNSYFDEAKFLASLLKKEELGKILKNYTVGSVVQAKVQMTRDFGTIFTMKDSLVTGFAISKQTKGIKCTVGQELSALILDVDHEKGILDLSLRPEFVEKAKKAKPMKENGLRVSQTVEATVELVKENYLVLWIHDYNMIGYSPSRDFNQTHDPFTTFHNNQKCKVTIQTIPQNNEQRLLLSVPTIEHQRKHISFSSNEGVLLIDDLKQGDLVKVKIVGIHDVQMNVALGPHLNGRIHITEVLDQVENIRPFEKYKIGDTLEAKVLQIREVVASNKYLPITHQNPSLKHYIDLTIKPSQLKLPANQVTPIRTLESLQKGQIVDGIIHKVTVDAMWVHISSDVRGRIFLLDASHDIEDLRFFQERFRPGQGIRCKILAIDTEKKSLDLSSKAIDTHKKDEESPFNKGTIVIGRVARIIPSKGINIQLSSHIYGRVFITDINDIYRKNPLSQFEELQLVKCFVLGSDKNKSQIDLSLRPSRLESSSSQDEKRISPEISSLKKLKVGDIVRGYVDRVVEKKGCFVNLSRKIVARVTFSQLSDTFIRNVDVLFPPGKMVIGKILSIEDGKVEMSLKHGKDSKLFFNTIDIGQKVRGTIKRLEKFGVFIQLKDSNLVGLCHLSEVSDQFVKDLSQLYQPGDSVKALVIKKNPEKKQISLSLKKSHFVNDPPSESEEEEEEEQEGGEDQEEKDDDEEEEDGMDIDDEEKKSKKEEEEEEDMNVEEDDEEEKSKEKKTQRIVEELGIAPGFQWEDFVEKKKVQHEKDEEDEDEENEKDEDEDTQKKSKKSKKKDKFRKEKEMAEQEEALIEGKRPKTAADFEKLLFSSPNNSYLWVQFMAFHISITEIDTARSIAERALKIIDAQQTEEKLNIWVAWMNLENKYGSQESLDKVFQKSLLYNEPKVVHLRLAEIYERSNNVERADQLYKTMISKFKESSKVWKTYGTFLIMNKKTNQFREIITRCLKTLPKKKHVPIVAKFAELEFKHGSAEHGRTLFENILSNYPKRTDIWNVYIDMEIKIGSVDTLRHLFERVTSLNLSSKKMKGFFKKYLVFEKANGTPATVNHVTQKAASYVDSKMK